MTQFGNNCFAKSRHDPVPVILLRDTAESCYWFMRIAAGKLRATLNLESGQTLRSGAVQIGPVKRRLNGDASLLNQTTIP